MMLSAIPALMVGLVLGVILHRSGFCLHSGFRLVLRGERSSSFFAYLLALAVQMTLVNTLAANHFIVVPNTPLVWAPAIFGGVIFGLGMIWAKG